MAHQTDVHIVKQSFEPENPAEKVRDPVCGAEIERRAARHVLFRENGTFYFCSRDCQQRFMSPAFKRSAAA